MLTEVPVRVCTRAHTRPHASFLLELRYTCPRLTVRLRPKPRMRPSPRPCPPRALPLLTLLLHAALQALAEAAGLALAPGLPCDFAGALPEGTPQPGVAFHGSPTRKQRAKVRFGEHLGFLGWGWGGGSKLHLSLDPVVLHTTQMFISCWNVATDVVAFRPALVPPNPVGPESSSSFATSAPKRGLLHLGGAQLLQCLPGGPPVGLTPHVLTGSPT